MDDIGKPERDADVEVDLEDAGDRLGRRQLKVAMTRWMPAKRAFRTTRWMARATTQDAKSLVSQYFECQRLEPQRSACNAVFTGTVANGGTCSTGQECVSGLCITGGSSSLCAAPFQIGQSCYINGSSGSSGSLCVSGAYPVLGADSCVCTQTQGNG